VIDAFAKAVAQLFDPAVRGVLRIGVAIAVLVFAVLWTTVGALLAGTETFAWAWLEWALDVVGGVATVALTWLLFPGVISAATALFLDRVAEAVERRHYPELGPAAGVPATASVVAALKFFAVMLGFNIVLLAFLLIWPVFPFVFYGVNGYLLGREYFELVALRRLGAREARALRLARRGPLILAGALVAILLTIPVVNLVAPVVATAAMVHLFEAWRRAPTA
jgi:CysZ protein